MLSLQQQVARWCTQHGYTVPITVQTPYANRTHCLPNGTPLTQSQWELYVLSKNVQRTNNSRKLSYCY